MPLLAVGSSVGDMQCLKRICVFSWFKSPFIVFKGASISSIISTEIDYVAAS